VRALIDLLGIDQHRVTSSSSTPTQSIANKRGTDSTTMEIGVHREALEVSEAAGNTGDVVADDAVAVPSDSESGSRGCRPGIDQSLKIESPEAVEGQSIELEDRGDVPGASASKGYRVG
jgi:hypothetical protein